MNWILKCLGVLLVVVVIGLIFPAQAQVAVGFETKITQINRADNCPIDRESSSCVNYATDQYLNRIFDSKLTFDFGLNTPFFEAFQPTSSEHHYLHPVTGRPIGNYYSRQFFGWNEKYSKQFEQTPLVNENFALSNPFSQPSWNENIERSVYSLLSFAGMFRTLSIYEDTGEVRYMFNSWSVGQTQNWNSPDGAFGSPPQYVIYMLLQGNVGSEVTPENYSEQFSAEQFMAVLRNSIGCEDCLTLDGGTIVIDRSTGESLQTSVSFSGISTMQAVTVTAVPEPSTYALLGIGLLAVGWRSRQLRRWVAT